MYSMYPLLSSKNYIHDGGFGGAGKKEEMDGGWCEGTGEEGERGHVMLPFASFRSAENGLYHKERGKGGIHKKKWGFVHARVMVRIHVCSLAQNVRMMMIKCMETRSSFLFWGGEKCKKLFWFDLSPLFCL